MSECAICCDKFTKKLRRPIECGNCNFSACKKCIETYVLDTPTEAKCMNCNHAYSTVFLYDNFSATFITKYRRHRSDIIWTRQLFHLPVINDYMGFLKEEKKMKEEVKRIKIRLNLLTDEYTSYRGKRDSKTVRRRAEIREEKKQVNGEITSAYRRGGEASYDAYALKREFTRNETITKKSGNNRPCITENCKGFLNSVGECPLCSKITCLTCNIHKTENHECKQEDIDSWENIKKSTRPCPKCNIRIHKIHGCDQMFCTSCHTAFSWNRGTIETGPIHNPHYYEIMFNQNRNRNQAVAENINANVMDCENEDVMINIAELRYFLRQVDLTTNQEYSINKIHRNIQHLIYAGLPTFENNEMKTRELTFKLLCLHIQGSDVRQKFEQNFQKEQVNQEFYTVLNSYKRQQIHNFKCWLNHQISIDEMIGNYNNCKVFYKDTVTKLSKVYKRTINHNNFFPN